MAKTKEENATYDKIVKLLTEKNIKISYPICVNTSNVEPDIAYISCNYMSTGVHIPISEIDFADFRLIDPEKMKHCATWSYIEK